MRRALAQHWPEYLIEAALLGLFMISAGLFTSLIESPQSRSDLVLNRRMPDER